MSTQDAPKRKPGGQPGNQNARKHGRYAAQQPHASYPPFPEEYLPKHVPFDPDEAVDSARMLHTLKLEIEAISAARAYVLSFGAPQTYAETLEFLRAVSQSGNAVARLVRVYLQLAPNFAQSAGQKAFWEGLHLAKVDMGLKSPDDPVYPSGIEKNFSGRKRRW